MFMLVTELIDRQTVVISSVRSSVWCLQNSRLISIETAVLSGLNCAKLFVVNIMKVTKKEVVHTKTKTHRKPADKSFESPKLKLLLGKCVSCPSSEPNVVSVKNLGGDVSDEVLKDEVMPLEMSSLPEIPTNNSVTKGTSVIWSNEGILRQALMCFNYTSQEDKLPKSNRNSKLSGHGVLTEILPPVFCESIETVKLSQSPPPVTSDPQDLKASSQLSAPVTLEGLPSAPMTSLLVPVSVSGDEDNTTIVSTPSSSSSPVVCSLPVSDVTKTGVFTSVPFSGCPSSVSTLLDVVPSRKSPLKKSLKYSAPTSSCGIGDGFLVAPIHTLSSKEASVTLVYSSLPKHEPSSALNTQSSQTGTVFPSPISMKTVPGKLIEDNSSKLGEERLKLPSTVGDSQESEMVSSVVDSKISVASHSSSHLSFDLSHNSSLSCNASIPVRLNGSTTSPLDMSCGVLNNMQLLPSTAPLPDGNQIITIPLTSTIYGHLPVALSSTSAFPLLACTSSTSVAKSPSTSPLKDGIQATCVQAIPSPIVVHSFSQVPPIAAPATTASSSSSSILHNSVNGLQSLTSVGMQSLTSVGVLAGGTQVVAGNSTISIANSGPPTSVAAVLATQEISASTLEPAHFPVHSEAELLLQLPKDGVLPAMSCSQVSSVLSDLGHEGGISCHLDLDGDTTHHDSLVTHQVHLSSSDKSSSLSHTEELVLGQNVSSDDTIIVQHVMHMLTHQQEHHHIALPVKPPDIPTSTQDLENPVHLVSQGGCDIAQRNSRLPSTKTVPELYEVNITKNLLDISNVETCSSTVQVPEDLNTLDAVTSSGRSMSHFIAIKEEHPENMHNAKNRTVAAEIGTLRLNGEFSQPAEKSVEPANHAVSVGCKEKKKRKRQIGSGNTDEIDYSQFIEPMPGFKCKLCLFMSPGQDGVRLHVRQEHSAQLLGGRAESRRKLKCPGCPNVFYCSRSLKVHLSQDHQVGDVELKSIVETVINSSNQIKYDKKKARRKVITEAIESVGVDCVDGIELGALEENMTPPLNSMGHVSLPEVPCIVEAPIVNPGIQTELSTELPAVTQNAPRMDSNSVCVVTTFIPDETSKIRVRNLNTDNVIVAVKEHDLSRQALIANQCVVEEGVPRVNEMIGEETRSKGLLTEMEPLQQAADTTVSNNFEVDVKNEEGHVRFDHFLGSLISTTGRRTKKVQKYTPDVVSSYSNRKSSRQNGAPVRKRGRPRGSITKSLVPQNNADKSAGYRCDVLGCAIRLQSHDKIEYHRRCHKENSFKCPECLHKTDHWNPMSSHLWQSHSIDMELYTCDQCNYKTTSYSKLMNLHHRIHGDERPFLCDTCGKGFKNQKQLRNHKTTHMTKLKQLPLAGGCDICGRSFSNLRMLRLHKDNVHGKLRPHSCSFCGYSASSRSSLKMHMRQHTGEKPFKCEECSYCTSDHNSLRRHKMRHSGDKPYKCPLCPYACIQSNTYKAHLRNKHPGSESGLMFSCWFCSFRSVRKDNYLAHVAEHMAQTHLNGKQKDKVDKAKSKRDVKHSPMIIDLSSPLHDVTGSSDSQEVLPFTNGVDVSSEDNIEMVYSKTAVVEELINQAPSTVCKDDDTFVIEMEPESVLQMNEHESMSPPECSTLKDGSNMDSMMMIPLTPLPQDFEGEEITGDIHEPQELKFKVLVEDATT